MADLPILLSPAMVRAILREIEQPGTGKSQHRVAACTFRPVLANIDSFSEAA